MTVLIPRTRTVNVRLSEAEYEELERFCVSSSARSLSELVRNTLQRLVHGANPEPGLASSVIENAAHVKDLQLRIEMLSTEIAALRATARQQPSNGAGGLHEREAHAAAEDGMPGRTAGEPAASKTES